MSLSAYWQKLPPKRKQIAVLAAVAAVGTIALSVFGVLSSSDPATPATGTLRTRAAPADSTSLIGKSEAELQRMGVPALDARVAQLEKTIAELRQTQPPVRQPEADLGADIPLPGVPAGRPPGPGNTNTAREPTAPLATAQPPRERVNLSPPSLAQSGAPIPALEPKDNRTDLQPPVSPQSPASPPRPRFQIRSTDERSETPQGPQSAAPQPVPISSTADAAGASSQAQAAGSTTSAREGPATPGTQPQPTVRATASAVGDRVRDTATADTEQILPSGSMLSGVMLTGLDAPTSNQGRRDPIPVLVRIKSEAILPNRFTLDLRECFLLASGFGDLSSERAYIRAERLSCVREDGKVIDTTLDATLQGRDGKAGLRGRVVHKNGQLIANSLMTGFLSGFSSALGGSRQPSIIVGQPGSRPDFALPDLGDIARAGALTGVGNAVGKIADYYLEMGRSIFPVIEIDAGQEVDFITTSAQRLKLGVSGAGLGASARAVGAATIGPLTSTSTRFGRLTR